MNLISTTSPLEPGAFSPLEAPREFYLVLDQPALLAGMRLPDYETPWETLHELGFRWVVCLCSEHPRYDPDPLERLVITELCDMVERETPENAEAEIREIDSIAEAVLSKLNAGEGVIVHCAGGRGRTGTVMGVVLRQLGFPAERIVEFLNETNQARGKSGWPEAPWQAEVVRR